MEKYYPLVTYSNYGSISKSILKISEYVSKAKEYKLNYLIITDYCSLSAIYKFRDECISNKIKPVYGMEINVCNDIKIKSEKYYSLILFAKNQIGLENLIKIHNFMYENNFCTEPRIDLKHLKNFSDGIICLSTGINSEIAQCILNNDFNKPFQIATRYKKYFKNFFLSLSIGNSKECRKLNKEIIQLSIMTDTPIVITNNIKYLNKNDYEICRAHMKDNELNQTDAFNYFMDYKNLKLSLAEEHCLTNKVINIALENNQYIVEQCNSYLPTITNYPVFSKNSDDNKILYMLCYKKLSEIIDGKMNPSKYIDRLEKELTVIKEKNFSGYFLIVHDYVNYAKKANIGVGTGRGSASGSLVSYLLGISQADPIKYNLMFERFLDVNRFSKPDIDVDVSFARRDEIFNYLKENYGEKNCLLISTNHTRKAKTAIKDAGITLGISQKIMNNILNSFPYEHQNLTINSALISSSKLQYHSKKYPELFYLAKKLEELSVAKGIHNSGILLSNMQSFDKLPCIQTDSRNLTTTYCMQDIEKYFLKFDLLPSITVELISRIEEDTGFKFNYQNDTLFEDDETWKIIGSKNTTGIFQISSSIYQQRMEQLKPNTIEELANCLALLRSPCINVGADKKYIEISRGQQMIEQIHSVYDKITENTNGILIYQEQVMMIFKEFGFDSATGYDVIKAISKKEIIEIKKFRETFIKKASENNCDKNTANKIFSMIEKSAGYLFNKAHAISYALMVYACAYFKVHYKIEHMKNLLSISYTQNNKENYQNIINECKRLNIKFLPPDVNNSTWNFSIINGKIQIGFCAIKCLNKNSFEEIYKIRPIKNLDDVLQRISRRDLNKQMITSLIFSGAFGGDKNKILKIYGDFLNKYYVEKISDVVKIGNAINLKISDSLNVWQKEIFSATFF